jgi:hypothetical protein
MKTQGNDFLVERVREALIPRLFDSGFKEIPLSGKDARSREIRSAFPFGRMRRTTAEGCDALEVQFDKRGRLAFRINLGRVPTNGIDHSIGGHILLEDVWVAYLPNYFEVYDNAMFRVWFGSSIWPFEKISHQKLMRAVERAASVLPEIEAVLSSNQSGKHVRRISVRR